MSLSMTLCFKVRVSTSIDHFSNTYQVLQSQTKPRYCHVYRSPIVKEVVEEITGAFTSRINLIVLDQDLSNGLHRDGRCTGMTKPGDLAQHADCIAPNRSDISGMLN